LVRSGGRIVYITCSILPEENDDALAAFMERHAGFKPVKPSETLASAGLESLQKIVRPTTYGLQMTPLKTGTDGFYAAVLTKE
jgi:16S rRNA (cytosine967-C5)-methyltransferase